MSSPTKTTLVRPFGIAVEQFPDGGSWTGGGIYHQNLFAALRARQGAESIETTLFYRQGEPPCTDLADRMVELPVASRPTLAGRVFRGATRRLPMIANPAERLARVVRASAADVLFTPSEYPRHAALPIVGWIPDFQHERLAGMASDSYAATARAASRAVAERSDVVVLSSEDACADFRRLLTPYGGKARVVPFVSALVGARFDVDPQLTARKYGLPARFFLLPNQFWKHKDHATVVRALSLLRSRLPALTIVATGNTADHRNPGHFPSLLGEIATAGVHDTFRILGLIPRGDLFGLYRQAVAVLQPSLFEGWSTSIEEAKSIGKGVVASDLPVHREQLGEHGRFFRATDAEALAGRLVQAWDELSGGPDAAREAVAAAALPGRLDVFARQFLAAARAAVSARGHVPDGTHDGAR